jgi:hypothetical protein
MSSSGVRSLAFGLTAFLAIGGQGACGRSTSQTGGTGGSGGNSATGGAIATGGNSATGGAIAAGGSITTGGRTGSGGVAQSGGVTGMDAAVDAAQATGGASSSGGRTGSGGNTQRGGTTGAGGAIDADLGLQTTLAAAVEQWKAAKTICPNYRYDRGWHSVFGSCSTTAVVIAADQPIGRSFVQNQNGCVFDGGATTQWEEVGSAQIGTHRDGSPAKTVEQLLEECQTIMAEDPSKYRFRLVVNPGGVPTTCVKTMNNCYDDCTSGIQLTSFSCDIPPALDASAG